jgi:hypothetical protein
MRTPGLGVIDVPDHPPGYDIRQKAARRSG